MTRSMLKVMMLIGYNSTSSYKLYSPNNDKLVVSRDVLVDERKGRNWIQGSIKLEKDTVETVLEKDQQNQDPINQNEERP